MASTPSNEQRALLSALNRQREHIFAALQGLEGHDLVRHVLPSGWTCIGLVNHLSLDVERFWFQAVIAGDQRAIDDVLSSSDNAWEVSTDKSAESVLQSYRDNIERAEAVMASRDLDTPPNWWPDFFGSWRLDSLREIVLHVIAETATHCGHLDAARELIDGKLHLVLTE